MEGLGYLRFLRVLWLWETGDPQAGLRILGGSWDLVSKDISTLIGMKIRYNYSDPLSSTMDPPKCRNPAPSNCD